MAHISLPEGVYGIGGPMTAYPETETHLNGLAHALLRGTSSLSPEERETDTSHYDRVGAKLAATGYARSIR